MCGENEAKKGNEQVIRNKDIQTLADILSLMQLVTTTEQQLDWQHERMLSLSQHLTGMPGGGVLPKGLDDALAALEEAGEAHKEKITQYMHELREAKKVLDGIESRTMLAFVVMKYVMGIADTEIRRELNMTEWGFARARKSVEEANSMAEVIWREKYILADTK